MKYNKALKCPICDYPCPGSADVIDIVQDISRLRCKICGLIFFEKKPNDLPVYDFAYNKHFYRPGDIRKAGIMAATLAEVASKNHKHPEILEIGPGNGLTAYLLKRMGYNISVLEEENDQAKYISWTYGLPIHIGNFEDSKYQTLYTLIYAGHVLEHSWKPLKFLRKAYDALQTTGVLYTDTPDAHYAKKYGPDWHHFKTRHPFEHCSIFGVQTIEAAAKKTGFKIEEIITKPEYQSFQAILRRG